MSELQYGDSVLTLDTSGQLAYSDVILFFHQQAAAVGNYLRLETSSGRSITITPNHLIHTSSARIAPHMHAFSTAHSSVRITFASNVEQGHYIYTVDSLTRQLRAEQVVRVSQVRAHGLYAPLTKHGTIVVNDYVTSCYAQIDSHSIAHACLAPMRLVYDLYSTFIARPTPHLNSSQNTLDNDFMLTSNNQNGVHWYADILHSIALYVIPHSLLYNT